MQRVLPVVDEPLYVWYIYVFCIVTNIREQLRLQYRRRRQISPQENVGQLLQQHSQHIRIIQIILLCSGFNRSVWVVSEAPNRRLTESLGWTTSDESVSWIVKNSVCPEPFRRSMKAAVARC